VQPPLVAGDQGVAAADERGVKADLVLLVNHARPGRVDVLQDD